MIDIVKNWIKNLTGIIGLEPEVESVVRGEAVAHKPKEIKIGKGRKSPPATTTVDPLYEQMTKRELETYAREKFNVDLDRRHNKKRLLNQIHKLEKKK